MSTKTEIDFKKLFITQPTPSSAKFHIFNKSDNRSLCNRYMMLIVNQDMVDEVTGTETFCKSQDCKTCFKKAGLKLE